MSETFSDFVSFLGGFALSVKEACSTDNEFETQIKEIPVLRKLHTWWTYWQDLRAVEIYVRPRAPMTNREIEYLNSPMLDLLLSAYDKDSMLLTAFKDGNVKFVEWSIKMFKISNIDLYMWRNGGLAVACQNGNLEMVKYIYPHHIGRKDSYVEYALKNNHHEVVSWLMEQNPDIDLNEIKKKLENKKHRKTSSRRCSKTRRRPKKLSSRRNRRRSRS